MKIEKVNDHQIRCTLTKADLVNRDLKISELAYGTEKAKNLFRDMMQQASLKFGFEAEDIPLMIEAIPLNGDCIVLIITKVEDPEELDTRFSKFAPSVHDSADGMEEYDSHILDGADDILDLFKKVQTSKKENLPTLGNMEEISSHNEIDLDDKDALPLNITKIFSFVSLHDLTHISTMLNTFYDGTNSLYKDTKTSSYYLVLTTTTQDGTVFNKVCNMLSEYGNAEKVLPFTHSYLEEHYELIICNTAIQSLAKIC